VIIADTDHLWGIGGDRTWVWKSFLRGVNPIFMDPYNCSPDWPPQDDCNPNDPTWVSLRRSLGYTRIFAQRMNLVALTPSYSLASTGYCLANAVADDATYLVYAPEGGEFKVDLAATTHELQVEWFDPETGASQLNGTIMGGGVHSFTSPLPGDALLYLHEKSGH
jgi:hypothetical protein